MTYRIKVYIPESLVINLEERPLSISVISTTVLLLFLIYLPNLSQDDSPQYHILNKGLLRKDFIQLLFSLDVLGLTLQNLERIVSIVGKEGFTEIREFNALSVFNVKVLDKSINFSLCIMYFHF